MSKLKKIVLYMLSCLVLQTTLYAYSTGDQIEVTNCDALLDYGVAQNQIDQGCNEGTYTYSDGMMRFKQDAGEGAIEDLGGSYAVMTPIEMITVNSFDYPKLDSFEAFIEVLTGGGLFSASNPANGATHVPLDENITLEFSENVEKNSSYSSLITLHDFSDNSIVQSFNLSNASDALIVDTNITLIKNVSLEYGSVYYLKIPAGLIVSEANSSVAYEGIDDNSSLKFSTNSLVPIDDIADVNLTKNAQAYKIDLNPLLDLDGDDVTLSASSSDTSIATVTTKYLPQIGADIDGEAEYDNSGNSVSLSSDGSVVAIGAYKNDVAGSDAGHVRVYKNNNGTWTQVGTDIDGEAAGDYSGFSVSLSSDGSVVAIGATRNDGSGSSAGHVRVYKNSDINNNGTWTQIGADIDGEAAGDYSGNSVSLSSDGSVVAIGAYQNDGAGSDAGHVRVYKNDNGTWTQIGADIDGEAVGDYSGNSVSLSSDGSVVAIGATRNDGSGSSAGHVRVYKNDNGTWTQIGADIDGEAAGDQSGYSVSLSSDGSVVAIGAYGNGAGHVRVYKNDNGTWTQIGADIDGEAEYDNSGYSVSLSSDGSVVAIGAIFNGGTGSSAGHVRVYTYLDGTWTQLVADIDGEAAGDQSGYSVSLSSDGSVVAIGAIFNGGTGSSAGHVRVYSLENTLTLTPVNDAEGVTQITLTANDGYDTVSKSFTLTVGEPNAAPTDISLSSNTIAENSASDATIGTLSTTDSDEGDTHTYSLCGGTDDANFTISGSELKANAVFDYETKSSYSVCVRTRDSANATFDKNITITITDVNETPTPVPTPVPTPTPTPVPEPEPEPEPTPEPEVNHELGDVSATSELEGTQTQTDPSTGDITTSTTTTNDSDEDIDIEVVAKADGEVKAIHSLKVGTKETKAESELSNTKTTIKADKSVETSATLSENGSEIKVIAKSDGSASHEVKLSDSTTSQATSDIKGAQTYITQEGEVQTSVEAESYVDANGCTVKAVVLTDKDGESRSEFVKVCNGQEAKQPTVSETTPFEAGNTIRVYEDAEDANKLKPKIQTPVTKRLQF